jgi:hypothetical protein
MSPFLVKKTNASYVKADWRTTYQSNLSIYLSFVFIYLYPLPLYYASHSSTVLHQGDLQIHETFWGPFRVSGDSDLNKCYSCVLYIALPTSILRSAPIRTCYTCGMFYMQQHLTRFCIILLIEHGKICRRWNNTASWITRLIKLAYMTLNHGVKFIHRRSMFCMFILVAHVPPTQQLLEAPKV